MKYLVLPLIAAPLALAACSKPSSEPSEAATPSLAPMVSESEAMAPPVAPGASASASAPAADGVFPVAMRGKWGINAADCDPSRGDDKGAITVGEKSVRFYESVGQIASVKDIDRGMLRAVFDYEGEGMKWQREASYKLEDGGKTLVLTEFGEDAPQGPRRHSRCK